MDHIKPWPKFREKVLPRNRYFIFIFGICKVIGIFPYHLKNSFFSFSKSYCITSVAGLCFVGCFTVHFLSTLPTSHAEISRGLVRSSYFVLMTGFYWVSVLSSFFRAPSVNKIFFILDDIDRLLLGKGFRVLDSFSITLSFKELLSGFFGIMFMLYSPWINSTTYHCFRLYVFLVINGLLLSSAQFSVLARLIQSRVSEVCDSLDDIRLLPHNSIRTKRIALLSDVHSKLCDACAVLEKSYSSLIMALVAVCFFAITACAFYIVSDPCTSFRSGCITLRLSDTLENSVPIMRVISVFIAILCVWEIVDCSSDTSQKVHEFNVILYNTMLTSKTQDITNEEKLKLHIYMKREVAFTAFGFFPLNYTLLHSMAAAVTSYLVILIQFQQATGNATIFERANTTTTTTIAVSA